MRGHNPMLYDLGIIAGLNPPDPSAGQPSFASLESARKALGDTLRYAQKMKLIEMVPHGELTSTGYALANPGKDYLVLQPSAAVKPFSVELNAGIYAVEWFSVDSREMQAGEVVIVKRKGKRSFTPPFMQAGPVVLFLKRQK